jgi:hypothetical protein
LTGQQVNLMLEHDRRDEGTSLCGLDESPDGHDKKKERRCRPWRHPIQRHIEVPYRVAAAIAVMEMGVSEYPVIAHAVGLTVGEIKRIDLVEDATVKKLAVAGIPVGEWFRLDHLVRCPRCQAKVAVAPCVACRSC